jgi:phage-related holin
MNDFLKWLLFTAGSAAAYFDPIHSVLLLVFLLFVIDFITGITKSIRQGECIK